MFLKAHFISNYIFQIKESRCLCFVIACLDVVQKVKWMSLQPPNREHIETAWCNSSNGKCSCLSCFYQHSHLCVVRGSSSDLEGRLWFALLSLFPPHTLSSDIPRPSSTRASLAFIVRTMGLLMKSTHPSSPACSFMVSVWAWLITQATYTIPCQIAC